MDIKIITKRDTFIIYKPITTLKDLKTELRRLKIDIKDVLIYFYDNESDKVVILDDSDLLYAIQQAQEVRKGCISLFIYYKLKNPKINMRPPIINVQPAYQTQPWLNNNSDSRSSNEKSPLCKSQTMENGEGILDSVPIPVVADRPTIQKEIREEKLKMVIDNFIDKMLKEKYEI